MQVACSLTAEARALEYLAQHSNLPVPRVLHCEDSLLILEEMRGRTGADPQAELHAAELLADVHGRASIDRRYGLGFDVTIGPLPQPNTWADTWPDFFRAHRLHEMARHATAEGRLPSVVAHRIEALSARLDDHLPSHPVPSLIHGDIWSGNVLSKSGRITAFLDPAPYHAHAEIELAFIDLFSTFGPDFHKRYETLRGTPVDERREYMGTRRDVYNCYPLLVHVRIFGGHYVDSLSQTLFRIGF